MPMTSALKRGVPVAATAVDRLDDVHRARLSAALGLTLAVALALAAAVAFEAPRAPAATCDGAPLELAGLALPEIASAG